MSSPGEPGGERLQKVLAQAGLGSRRACEELVAAGRVTVNGQIAALGRRVEVEHDVVEVDGALVPVADGLVHYVLNKPRGVITTADDPQGRPTVLTLVPPQPRVFPVGRLDGDTEGVLVLTNDGALAHRLTHPSFGVVKEYLAEVSADPTPAAIRAWREGVELDDGPTAPATVARVAPAVVRFAIHEGRNRQIRRMCEALGYPVRRLVRTRFGPLDVQGLAPAQWRPLAPSEVRALAIAAAAPAPKAPRRANRVKSKGRGPLR